MYTKINEDILQIIENGKASEESVVLKLLKESNSILTERMTKPNTFDWDLMNLTLLHMLAYHAKDDRIQIIEILKEAIRVILNSVDDSSAITELRTKAQRTPLMVAC